MTAAPRPASTRMAAALLAGAPIVPALLAGVLFSGCVVTRPGSGDAAGAAESGRLSAGEISAGVLGAMDRGVDPCQDFYQYACGGWLRDTKLPPDRPRLGRGFAEVEERNRLVLRDILEDAVRRRGADPDTERLGDFYGACTDETALDRLGVAPLQGFFTEIASINSPSTLMTALGHLHLSGIEALFGSAVDADFKDPNLTIAHWLQGGLGLPDRDHYLKDDEKSRTLRTQYEAHVARMLALAGAAEDEAKRQASAVVAFETRLARASLSRVERRDPEKIYHRIDRAGLQGASAALPWDDYFAAVGFPDVRAINVGMPEFFSALSDAVTSTPMETLQAYLRWQVVDAMADSLPRAFADEHFAFFGRILDGQQEIEPRWKRCVDATDEAMGELLGRAFVERRFAGDSKTTALEMIRGIEKALEDTFPTLAWMDDATRDRAREKLAAVANKIGYPDAWRDYSSLKVRRGEDFGNRLAASRFEFRRQFSRVGGPVDRKEWGISPPTVNAFYSALRNEMVFPAGILQPPFFHRDFPRAMNYGAMGMGMGHELTHGFDDQGRKFDPQGQLREWWDPA
ncbi:MAG TPA: M13 family metallopeptidase, partial [Candidatus Polarisedimenticolia bacterium]|nr:M13 family metallopeptidase [Candidatus Polarisedimenticolia bacterium]